VPAATDTEGCSYLLKVQPGTYDVTVSRPNFVDKDQATSGAQTVGVAAGGAASVAFAYDLAGTVTARYGTNFTSGSTLLPNNLSTTFRSTYQPYTAVNASNANEQTFRLHPFGYEVFAGRFIAATPSAPGCLSVDPAAWTTPAADGAIGTAVASVATLPGGNATVDVPLGVLTVTGLPGQFLRAESTTAPAGSGDPGCGAPMSYTFGLLPGGTTTQLGLPFGSWTLFSGAASGSETTPVPATSLAVLTRGVAAGGVVTLDPRAVAP
jgi:hypothetical protein